VVSRDVGFRPAVPLPAVAILLGALLVVVAPACISQGLNGLRLFGNHCLSFIAERNLANGVLPCFPFSRPLCILTAFWAWALANGVHQARRVAQRSAVACMHGFVLPNPK
jgi:hypothetical protein